MPELAKAYVTIIPAFEKGIQKDITSAIAPAAGGAGTQAGAVAGENMAAGMGAKLKAGLAKYAAPAAIAAAVIAAGKALYDLGESFDAMFDTIRVGTGATGENLKALEDDALSVMKTVPNSMEEIGQVVADLNTRLGISGDQLQDMARKYLEASNILGSEVDINKTTAAFNAFKLTGQDASDALDDLFTVAQSTGVSIDELATAVSSNAASMQMLGFDFQQTASMAGMLEKAGISASGTFSKMSKGLVTLAKDGEEPAEAFQRLTAEMEELVGKGKTTEAIDLASQLFGTKGAAQFIGAIESGALSIDDMTAALENNGNAILEAAADTRSLSETWGIFKNAMKTALEPLASGLFQGISDAIQNVMPYVQEVIDWVSNTLAPLFPEMEDGSSGIAETINTLLVPALKVVATVLGGIATVVGAVLGIVAKAVKETIQFVKDLKNRISESFDNIKAKISGVVDNVKAKLDGFRDKIDSIINKIADFFRIEIHWPHIPLPHFAITPAGWKIADLLKGQLPHLGIEWYASGGVITSPRVVGVGEAGPEAIVPLRGGAMQPFAEAIAEAGAGGNVYNVTIDVRRLKDLATVEDIADVFVAAARAGRTVRA